MGISYNELKYSILSEDDLTTLLQGFNFTPEEPRWTIVKYVVRDGDTIGKLCNRFKIPRTLILRLNALSPGSTLKQGEVLLLPELYG
ncbi:MAG: LysM peptidoglycan-binding domain-containing protein [Firmicutes bacterium]|mgnify:FL=1|nr:LysM peptidoglycan-binding domain-containing protein [Bacillota bacterium]